ncbi:helix-turn-helix domain-containing protein [Streptomyces sp. H27-D2]|uniref:helix-turn-helix domain-containing protein n=1 Tax=Streptomyces sp. H27-D2 TaxID=3046304 RepID=UPI002DBB1E05|nr:helix-turn-helix transcriptional regulator [Streptomyces sp. H27-D2]MEC4016259.1 helix-turn-helix transcriptional regulator [Streptomyces sp. H27-D2]
MRSRRLGSELRRLREAAGKTADQAAQVLECSRPRISRIENGLNPLRQRDLRDLLEFYEVTDATLRHGLEDLVRTAGQRGWWFEYGDTIPPSYADLIGLEAEAEYIRSWQLALVPGVLQTEAYARAVLEANPAGVDPAVVEQRVAVRMERRKTTFEGERIPRFWAIMWEPLLRTPVGGPGVMKAQLQALVRSAGQPQVTLQVLPSERGASAGTSGAFVMFQIPPPYGDVVFLESLTSSSYIESPEDIRGYTLAFDHLRSYALDPTDSLSLISEIASSL